MKITADGILCRAASDSPVKKLSALGAFSVLASMALAASAAQAEAAEPNTPYASSTKAVQDVTQTAAILQQRNVLSRTAYDTADRIWLWNEITTDSTAIDHTPVQPGETRVFGEQFGPARSARAMAIAHIALFEAVNAVNGGYSSYTGIARDKKASVNVAIAYAVHDALVYLYPSQKPRLDSLLNQDLATIAEKGASRAEGVVLGEAAAASIVALRTNDGSQYAEPLMGVNCSNQPGDCYTPLPGLGHWSLDPVNSGEKHALGAFWPLVKPFVIQSASQFRLIPPPALTSAEYATAYNEVKSLGGDPAHGTSTLRSIRQTFDGKFWSYDGTPALCAPPRLYNMVAATVARKIRLEDPEEVARYLALINTALADAALTAWDSKYYYQFWRPVTAIRSGADDGNPATDGDPTFYPLGGQASNTDGPNFTPPFPAYPSGHATFGGALFQMMRKFTPDQTPFVFVSDEWDGKTKDVNGTTRPYIPQAYLSLSQADEDNYLSRLYLGVHFRFDSSRGSSAGQQVADYVFTHAFLPSKEHGER